MKYLLLLSLLLTLSGCAPKCQTYRECNDEFKYKLYRTAGGWPFDWQDADLRAKCYEHFGDGAKECK